ncbi:MAG: thioredoxin family protein [Planctomycetales bacterium]|nr:thioredoxin family protein [Planctomycetales bacterium]
MIRKAAFLMVALAATVVSAESLEVGGKAPNFKGTGTDGKDYSLEGMKDAKAVVVCFTCNACPTAIRYEDKFIAFAKKYQDKGVRFVAINVNPEGLDAMKERAEEKGFPYPYIKDASGDSARAYGAKVTPHLYVLDGGQKLAYVGAFDQGDKTYVQDAVDAVLAGSTPEVTSSRPVGCGIRPARR